MAFKFKEIKIYKNILKEKEEIKLVSIIKEKEILNEEIKQAEIKYKSTQSKIRDLYTKNFNISLVQLYNDNLQNIVENIQKIENEIKKVDKKITEQKIIIKNATIEFKKFEKLEENYIKERNEKIKYNEKKELDETVSIREFHNKD